MNEHSELRNDIETGKGDLQGGLGDVPLPLEVALTSLNIVTELAVFVHKVNKLLGQLQVLCRDRAFATLEGVFPLCLLSAQVLCSLKLLEHVHAEHDEVEVLVDVVHDLGF